MKLVDWTDEKQWKHKSLIRDKDPISMASSGIPQDPPDVNLLDWEGIKRDLHNQLIDLGLVTWANVMKSQTGLTSVSQAVLIPKLRELYRAVKK